MWLLNSRGRRNGVDRIKIKAKPIISHSSVLGWSMWIKNIVLACVIFAVKLTRSTPELWEPAHFSYFLSFLSFSPLDFYFFFEWLLIHSSNPTQISPMHSLSWKPWKQHQKSLFPFMGGDRALCLVLSYPHDSVICLA